MLDGDYDENSGKVKVAALNRLRESPPNMIIECCIKMYADAREMAVKYYSE